MKCVVVTGGFDPLHSGHIKYFKEAKKLGDILCVGVNSDEWLSRKKGRPFMPFVERLEIINELSCVGHVFGFDDNDGSAINAIQYVKDYFPRNSEIIFANGGDRTKDNIPEMVFEDVEFVFGVGGDDKLNSSSWILNEWKAPKTKRPWGYYRVLHEEEGVKVKELVVEPGKSLSHQMHEHRSEYWLVSEGRANVITQENELAACVEVTKNKHQDIKIPATHWHRLSNTSDKLVRIIEIQYGKICDETDIIRKNSYK